MSLSISFRKTPKIKADTAIITVFKGGRLGAAADKLDRQHDGIIRHHLKKQDRFKGSKEQVFVIAAPKKSPYVRFVLVGLGEPNKLSREICENIGGKLYLALEGTGVQRAHFFVDEGGSFGAAQAASHIATGLKLRSYKFDKYKSKPRDADKPAGLAAFETILSAATTAAGLYDSLNDAASGTFLARDLVNEPPNVLYPDSFARMIKKQLQPLGVEVEVFDEKKMAQLGFNAHLAVGMGSARTPRVVIMRWRGGKKGKGPMKEPLAFVGKGVTFDTGGVNLKPTGGLEDMKLDMGGAAAVVGLFKTLALRKSKAQVVGVVGLAENMLSDRAYRPSDILKSLSGKTIEVMNTDAEGRLVLADCLTYVQRTYKPRLIIDLATLTGAMMMALGYDYCGTFVNNDALWKKLEKASNDTGENLWRMPLHASYKKSMESKIADVRSLGTMGRYAGACTAAGFLEHFIEDDTPWAHMDIAGTAWIAADTPTCPKPATGFGVRVLDRFIAMNYE